MDIILNDEKCLRFIGTQLKGQIIVESIGYGKKQRNYKRYVLSSDSIVKLRLYFGNDPIRVILPHCFYTQEVNPDRLSVIIDEDFKVSNIYLG